MNAEPGFADCEISRRQALRFLGLAGGALAVGGALSGCSNGSDRRLKFFNWQDYIDGALLSEFTGASTIEVSYSTYESNDELGDRLALAGVPRRGNRKASTFDLVVPSDNLFQRLKDSGRLQRLDSSIVTEALLGRLGSEFRSLPFDTGNRFSVPWATGSTGIGYDSSVFAEPPDWSVFLNSTYAGKMSLLDEKREAFAASLFSLGLDPNSTGSVEITKATNQLEAMKAQTAFNSATYLDDLASGKTVAAQAFSTDLLQARERNPKLAFVIPDAGGTRWVDLLCIPTDAPNPEAANRFIAFYLDPKVSAQNASSVKIDTGNDGARAVLSAAITSDPVVFPPANVASRLVFFRDLGDAEGRYNDAWDQVRG